MELELLGRAVVPGGAVTIAGDERQQVDATTHFQGWLAVVTELGERDPAVVSRCQLPLPARRRGPRPQRARLRNIFPTDRPGDPGNPPPQPLPPRHDPRQRAHCPADRRPAARDRHRLPPRRARRAPARPPLVRPALSPRAGRRLHLPPRHRHTRVQEIMASSSTSRSCPTPTPTPTPPNPPSVAPST